MAEFNIRLFAFKRMSTNRELLVREVAYYSMIGSHLNPKKLPKSKEAFWQVGRDVKVDKERVERMKEAMRKAVEQYNNRK